MNSSRIQNEYGFSLSKSSYKQQVTALISITLIDTQVSDEHS